MKFNVHSPCPSTCGIVLHAEDWQHLSPATNLALVAGTQFFAGRLWWHGRQFLLDRKED